MRGNHVDLQRRSVGRGLGRTAAGLGLLAGILVFPSTGAADATLKASYVISLGGVAVGHAAVESRFDDSGYHAEIRGSTRGLTRIVSNATAEIAGSGEIREARVLPTSYQSDTSENGFETQVRMAMQSGRVTDLRAEPRLIDAPDRVPVTGQHTIGVVDPLSAFLVPLDRPGPPVGRRVCDRTIKVFDGWMRFDVDLHYKATKAVDGGEQAYAGRIVVCSARYVPVAGHRSGREVVQKMAANERLEVWLAQVEGTSVLVPYRMLVGTRFGDLVIHATRFYSEGTVRRADASRFPDIH